MAEEREVYQVFVKLLDGKSKALNFPSPSSISPLSIKRRLSLLTGIPISDQLLVSGTGNLSDGPRTFPIFCNLLLRLCGGKGGFGSLLRGAATKAGQKKTNNFDACRDMSGRRLRHVNAEKRLEEWAAEAEERKLEKAAEEFLRKKMKAEGKRKKEGGGAEMEKYVGKYREDSARCMEVVEKSVREALGKKRKAKVGDGGEGSKKLKIWMGKRKVDDSDSDTDEDDSDDNGEQKSDTSVVLDIENHFQSNKEPEGSSDSVTGGKKDGSSSGGSSENNSDGDEETAVRQTPINGECSGEAMVEKTVQGNVEVALVEETVVAETVKTENGLVGEPLISTSSGEALETETADTNMGLDPASKPVENEDIMAKSTTGEDAVKPLNFEEFNSSAELEVLGMEKLKYELQLRGLKCGGTLQERAARLFLLKTTPLEKLPKKLLAKK